jgi:hypothetical protein
MASAENRYRKIEMRMWADHKFRELSPVPPSGQSLWLYLLTGPHTGIIPGLSRAGRLALAEALGWAPEAFEAAFDEIASRHMAKSDWNAGVVWIPNAIKCNPPQSPNVITAWRKEWPLIPDCDLKTIAYETIQSAVYAMGKGFREAFSAAFEKPSTKAFTKPPAKPMPNQEQLGVSSEQKTGRESSILLSPVSQNLSETVNRIGHLYPGNKNIAGKPLPKQQRDAISRALARDGAVAVRRWSTWELKYIPHAQRFYDECQYLKDPAVWGLLYPGEVERFLRAQFPESTAPPSQPATQSLAVDLEAAFSL